MLLDSQATLWLLDDSRRLGAAARAIIRQAAAVHVSAATIWELTIKSVLGKLSMPPQISDVVLAAGLTLLPVTGHDAEAIRDFPRIARHDPFDRLLVAQAHRRGLTLVTADRVLLGLGESFIVDAGR